MTDRPHWSDDYDQTESDQEYGARQYRRWVARQCNELFQLTAEEADAIYARCVAAFNKACDELERQEADAEIRRVLSAGLGAGTYQIEEPSR